jgi:uncharacterized membrane protein YgcG
MTKSIVNFIKTNTENTLIISGIFFVLSTILFIALITSSTLQNWLAYNNTGGYSITPQTYAVIMLLFFVILNIYCILFVLFVIYTTTSSNSVKLGNTDYWLFTSSLILTCLIVYDLCLFFILQIILKTQVSKGEDTVIELTIINTLVPVVQVLIPVLIISKLIIGLSAICLYLHNYDNSGDTFEFKTFFISTSAIIITIAMNKLFRVAYKMDSGAISENKFVYGLLCLLVLLIVYLIVLDIKNNKTQLSSSYYKVAIALLIVFILALFIFFIYSIFFKKKKRGDGGGGDGGGGDGGGDGGGGDGGGYKLLDPDHQDYSYRDSLNRSSIFSELADSNFGDDTGDLRGFFVRLPK